MAADEERATRRFYHHNEITWGEARIPFAPAIHGRFPAGWALPGGSRTTSRELAQSAAQEVNEQIRACNRRAKSDATALIRSAMKKETSA